MAAGLPVIVSKVVGYVPDLVINPKTRFTFNPFLKMNCLTY